MHTSLARPRTRSLVAGSIAIVAALALGGGVALAATRAVSISGFAFAPASITINAGDGVTWTNADAVAHTATARNGSFDTGDIRAGQSASVRFTQPGTYAYICTPHPTMTGTIRVRAASGPTIPATDSVPAPDSAPAGAAGSLAGIVGVAGVIGLAGAVEHGVVGLAFVVGRGRIRSRRDVDDLRASGGREPSAAAGGGASPRSGSGGTSRGSGRGSRRGDTASPTASARAIRQGPASSGPAASGSAGR